MTLTEALRRLGGEVPAGDADAAAWLAATVEAGRDGTLYTMAALPAVLGAEGTALVMGTLQAAGASNPLVWAATQKFCSTGLDLGDELVQQMIDTLAQAGSWPDELRDALKGIGVRHVPRWQSLGLSVEPTEADVAAARAKLAVTEYPLEAVLLSVNVSADGRASLSCRVTPCAVAEDGEVLTGTPAVLSFSGDIEAMDDRKRALVEAVLAALQEYRHG